MKTHYEARCQAPHWMVSVLLAKTNTLEEAKEAIESDRKERHENYKPLQYFIRKYTSEIVHKENF